MKIRKTSIDDLKAVMKIYQQARSFMRSHGNLEQWINNYPSLELVTKDIEDGNSYVVVDNKEIVAVMVFIVGDDPTYKIIENGQWLNGEEYGVVHRIASIKQGAGSYCLNWACQQIKNIRIDTHEDNYPMQNLLVKLGFKYCGIIYVSDGTPRKAYQKTMDS